VLPGRPGWPTNDGPVFREIFRREIRHLESPPNDLLVIEKSVGGHYRNVIWDRRRARRLRRALPRRAAIQGQVKHAGGVRALADAIDRDPSQVQRWLADETPPTEATLRSYSMEAVAALEEGNLIPTKHPLLINLNTQSFGEAKYVLLNRLQGLLAAGYGALEGAHILRFEYGRTMWGINVLFKDLVAWAEWVAREENLPPRHDVAASTGQISKQRSEGTYFAQPDFGSFNEIWWQKKPLPSKEGFFWFTLKAQPK